MNISKLNKLVESSGLNKSQIATRCGISRTTLDNVLNGADVKLSTVEALARVLNVCIHELYDDPVPATSAIATGKNSIAAVNSEVNGDNFLSERVKYLERILEEKERTIQILMQK